LVFMAPSTYRRIDVPSVENVTGEVLACGHLPRVVFVMQVCKWMTVSS
jgi:hypothetical protein